MNEKGASSSPAIDNAVQTTTIPFSSIPGQSRLFLDYLSDSLSLRRFYPNAVRTTAELKDRVPDILAEYRTDRDDLCSALFEINNGELCSETTRSNIEKLRRPNTVAVVTGQQAGLFTGPLYTLYKAITALKLAEKLNGIGVSAVPVFWIATEDHDFEEISRAFAIGHDGSLVSARIGEPAGFTGHPVGDIPLGSEINNTVRTFLDSLPDSEFGGELGELLTSIWEPDRTIGDSFARTMLSLLSDRGLVLVDPNNSAMKRLVSPIYRQAIENAPEIVGRLVQAGGELVESGYHAQVHVTDDYFPFFWITDSGIRSSIRKVGDGKYRSKADDRHFTIAELAEAASQRPENLSPGVMMRGVVQDYLFPTVCYVGGGAEIAYFAQSREVYRTLARPVTPIIHRQSFTLIGSNQARALEKSGIAFLDLFDGFDALVSKVVEKSGSIGVPRLFADVEEKINTELNRLDQVLSKFDPSLADGLAKRRKKIIYHIASLRKKTYLSAIRRDETMERRIRSALVELLPNGGLQERTLNLAVPFNKYGHKFIDWVYAATDVDERGHTLIYL